MRKSSLFPVAALLVTGLAAAQQTPDRAQVADAYLQQQQTAVQALRNYQWSSRIETKRKEKTTKVDLYQIKYGADGQPEETLQGQQHATELKKGGYTPMGIVIGAVSRTTESKQRKGFEADLENCLHTYRNIPPENIRGFFQNAMTQPGLNELDGTTRFSGGNVMQSGDSMSVWINPQTMETRQLQIDTTLEDKPMTIRDQYRKLPDGTPYTARTTLEIQSKKMQIITDNFDFARQGSQ
jgi:hypothetical protein